MFIQSFEWSRCNSESSSDFSENSGLKFDQFKSTTCCCCWSWGCGWGCDWAGGEIWCGNTFFMICHFFFTLSFILSLFLLYPIFLLLLWFCFLWLCHVRFTTSCLIVYSHPYFTHAAPYSYLIPDIMLNPRNLSYFIPYTLKFPLVLDKKTLGFLLS